MNRSLVGVFVLLMLVLGTTAGTAIAQEDEGTYQIQTMVVAPLLDAEGGQVGTVAFGDDEGKLGIVVVINGLTGGEHGMHLHETGNCDPAGENTFTQAGGHFNPGGMTHPNHAGDLGNLVVDDAGNALLLGSLGTLTFDDGEFGLADADGTAFVIHADPDDLATDPSGNSGARIACAVLSAPTA